MMIMIIMSYDIRSTLAVCTTGRYARRYYTRRTDDIVDKIKFKNIRFAESNVVVRSPSFIRSRRGRADDLSGGLPPIALLQRLNPADDPRRAVVGAVYLRVRRATDRLYDLCTQPTAIFYY